MYRRGLRRDEELLSDAAIGEPPHDELGNLLLAWCEDSRLDGVAARLTQHFLDPVAQPSRPTSKSASSGLQVDPVVLGLCPGDPSSTEIDFGSVAAGSGPLADSSAELLLSTPISLTAIAFSGSHPQEFFLDDPDLSDGPVELDLDAPLTFAQSDASEKKRWCP